MGWLTPEVLDLLERAASLPFGLQLLRLAPSDCVSTTLGVRVDVAEQARAALEDDSRSDELLEAYEVAVARRRLRPEAPLPPPLPGAPPPHGPEELIAELLGQPGGLQLLVDAPLETVAIDFCVHPFVVEAARELVLGRGLVAPSEDPDRPSSGSSEL